MLPSSLLQPGRHNSVQAVEGGMLRHGSGSNLLQVGTSPSQSSSNAAPSKPPSAAASRSPAAAAGTAALERETPLAHLPWMSTCSSSPTRYRWRLQARNCEVQSMGGQEHGRGGWCCGRVGRCKLERHAGTAVDACSQSAQPCPRLADLCGGVARWRAAHIDGVWALIHPAARRGRWCWLEPQTRH